MSDEEAQILKTEDGHILEYKDGQLQIVEVTPFDKTNDPQSQPETSSDGEQTKYLQMLDTNKGLVQLDLLNFTLVKCEDGDNSSYQVVGTSSDDGDTTLTCVLAEDTEEGDNHDSYVVMDAEEGSDPIVFLQSSLPQINIRHNLRQPETETKNKPLTPAQILEKAKALQKARALIQSEHLNRSNHRGRKRKSDLPPPMELLASPNFKLYLYSCKMCNFKCNAVKEMSKHKAEEHSSGKARGSGSRPNGTLQCARCPFRGTVHSQLMKHVQDVHLNEHDEEEIEDCGEELNLESGDMSDADVLVCGACGFESGDRGEFKKHIEKQHGVNVMLRASVVSIEEMPDSN